MLVNEILREKRLDEIAPFVIGGLTIPVILGYISAAVTAYTVIEIYQFINKYQENPDEITDDDWGDISIDIALAAVPALGKLGKPLILKMIPTWIKKKLGDFTKNAVLKKLNAEKADISKKYGAATYAGKTPAQIKQIKTKRRLALAKANQKAKQKLNKIKQTSVYNAILNGMAAGIFGKLFLDYWEKHELLVEEYNQVTNGDLSNYEGLTQDQALQKIADKRNKLVGELTIAVSAVITPLAAPKALKLFGVFFGKILPGGKFVKGAFDLPANLLAKYTQLGVAGAASLAAFIQTETGKNLLSNTVVTAITQLAGNFTTGLYNSLLNVLDSLLSRVGINLPMDKLKPTIKNPTLTKPPPPGNVSMANALQIKSDPKNPNVKYIDGKQVTGPDGYVLNTIPNTVRDIRLKARAFKLQDPFTQLKFDPNKQYTNLQL